MNTQTNFFKLAQSERSLPEPIQGQRIILDDQAQEAEVVAPQAPPLVSPSIFYGLGAMVLLVVAVLAAVSFLMGNKKKHRQELLEHNNPYPTMPQTPINTMAAKPESKTTTDLQQK